VAYAFDPGYSGGRDQEDQNLKPDQANSSRDPILKNPIMKSWAGGMAQGEGPEFKPQYRKKKKESRKLPQKFKYLAFLENQDVLAWCRTSVLCPSVAMRPAEWC
jgi:hypothetical protein